MAGLGGERTPRFYTVIPAEAGIHLQTLRRVERVGDGFPRWPTAALRVAGMTKKGGKRTGRFGFQYGKICHKVWMPYNERLNEKIFLSFVILYAAVLCFGLWKSLTAKSYFGSGFVFNFTLPFAGLNERILGYWFSVDYSDLFLSHNHRVYLVADAALSFIELCVVACAVYAFLQLRGQRRAKRG